MYICVFSRSVGAGNATTRKTRGLTHAVSALIRHSTPVDAHDDHVTLLLGSGVQNLPPRLPVSHLRLDGAAFPPLGGGIPKIGAQSLFALLEKVINRHARVMGRTTRWQSSAIHVRRREE